MDMLIEPVRVETGMIVTDYDYEPHQRSPFDLGLDRMVKPGNGCMGDAALKEAAAEHPNRFVTIRLASTPLPEYGSRVTRDGEEVGVLTSPAESPLYGPIGLAILAAGAAEPGMTVHVDGPEGPIEGTVDVLAIHDPKKERPRA